MKQHTDVHQYSPVDPARRHRCERCQHIFECQLCTIHTEHQLHRETQTGEIPFGSPGYVCKKCAETNGIRTIHLRRKTYDYLTGTSYRRQRRNRQHN